MNILTTKFYLFKNNIFRILRMLKTECIMAVDLCVKQVVRQPKIL